LTERLYELTTLNVRNRLHCELVRLSITSGVSNNSSLIAPAPTHTALANRIGANREAVTRELNELARMKIIAQGKRQIEVLDMLKLVLMVDVAGGTLASDTSGRLPN
jgi:CRP-like cAMP-binding protein